MATWRGTGLAVGAAAIATTGLVALVLGYVLAQARYDQNGCCSLQFVHFQHLRFLDDSTGSVRQGLFVGLTLKSARPKRFSLDVRHFSFHDRFPGVGHTATIGRISPQVLYSSL